MAIESIASVKSHFETGDRPTQQDFEALIDTVARETPIAIASAAEAGKTGVLEIEGTAAVTVLPVGAFGRLMLSVAATASARNALGVTSVASLFLEAASTASGQSLLGISSHQAAFLRAESTASSQSLLGGGAAGIGVYEAITTASAFSSIGISRYFESSEQTVAVDTLLTVAHGLGQLPKLVQATMRCKTTDAGYAVGDEVVISGAGSHTNQSDQGIEIAYDATNVYAVQGADLALLGKSTFNNTTLTEGNWRWVIRAWT